MRKIPKFEMGEWVKTKEGSIGKILENYGYYSEVFEVIINNHKLEIWAAEGLTKLEEIPKV